MTQEEKQLLFKDLCARLPYGVKLGFENSNVVLTPKDYCCFTWQLFTNKVFPEHDGTVEYGCQFYEYRPYLRPMSSMTEGERKELKNATCPNGTGYFNEKCLVCPVNHFGEQISFDFMADIIDWLVSHHFDFRGLIEKGLALEAKEGMYKTN